MLPQTVIEKLLLWAEEYNDPVYFKEDPIIFPGFFAERYHRGVSCLQDVEIAALIASHLAWGRRNMIVRDVRKAMDEMDWKPYDYVMKASYMSDNHLFVGDFGPDVSLHRTVKWREFALICSRLRGLYEEYSSLEKMPVSDIRTSVFGSKEDKNAPNKKINLMRRWMVRDDGKVDLGLWKDTPKTDLIIPLDVHVYTQAASLGLTSRRQKDLKTAIEITDAFRDIFPDDPCKGDFALFGYGVTNA